MSQRFGHRIAAAIILTALVASSGARLLATQVTTFRVTLGGVGVSGATNYQLIAADDGRKKLYTLRVARRLTNDSGWVSAYQTGQVYSSAVVEVLDNSLSVLGTYTLANAAVTSVQHVGAASDTFVTEEIVLVSSSMAVTP